MCSSDLDSTHILEFAHQFRDARVITLDQNYRSTSTILDAANDVIAKNKHRHPKRLWSDKGQGEPIQLVIAEEDRAEAKLVAEEILKLAQENIGGHVRQVRPWKDFAILYRSNPQSRLFEEALRLHMIPYRIVGSLSFLDRKEIKDLLSYWRLIINPKDDAAARRVANWPARGFGKIVVGVVGEPMFALLLGAGAIYLALGDPIEAAVLIGFAFTSVFITVEIGRAHV